MVSPKLNPQACWEFEGEILVLHHPTTISVKYQAMGMYIVSGLDHFIGTVGCGLFGSSKCDRPLCQLILSWRPSSTDSKRASCQLLAKEWTLSTG